MYILHTNMLLNSTSVDASCGAITSCSARSKQNDCPGGNGSGMASQSDTQHV